MADEVHFFIYVSSSPAFRSSEFTFALGRNGWRSPWPLQYRYIPHHPTTWSSDPRREVVKRRWTRRETIVRLVSDGLRRGDNSCPPSTFPARFCFSTVGGALLFRRRTFPSVRFEFYLRNGNVSVKYDIPKRCTIIADFIRLKSINKETPHVLVIFFAIMFLKM